MTLDLLEEPATEPGRRNKPPPVAKLGRKKLIPFGWYGGKFSHLDWLPPARPTTAWTAEGKRS